MARRGTASEEDELFLMGTHVTLLGLQGATTELGEMDQGLSVRDALIILKAKMERVEQVHGGICVSAKARKKCPFR